MGYSSDSGCDRISFVLWPINGSTMLRPCDRVVEDMAKVKTPTYVKGLQAALIDGLERAGIQAQVQFEQVPTTKLHRFFVVADKFILLSPTERQDIVWRLAEQVLAPDQQACISMIITLTPEEAGQPVATRKRATASK